MPATTADQFVASPACIPQMTLEEILPLYAGMGFRKFELFTSWCKSAVSAAEGAQRYLALAREHGMAFTSLHLPPITDDLQSSLTAAIEHARLAADLGVEVVLYKGTSRQNYIRGAKPFLDALDSAGLKLTPVLQNHKGSPITTLDDFREVITGIADGRMKTLLEVGHFQRVGVPWRQGYDVLRDSIALVHINEIDAAGDSVPFGTGLVDFPGLFAHLGTIGYTGNIVVELELTTRDQDIARTVHYLNAALDYLRQLCTGATA